MKKQEIKISMLTAGMMALIARMPKELTKEQRKKAEETLETMQKILEEETIKLNDNNSGN